LKKKPKVRIVTAEPLAEIETSEKTFTHSQIGVFIGILLGIGILISTGHTQTVFVVFTACATIIGLANPISKALLMLSHTIDSKEINVTAEQIGELKNENLPTVTILAPHYRETVAFPGQLESITKLDWPKEKLQVILLVREEDMEMLSMISSIQLPSFYQLVTFGEHYPKNKPRALMFGLEKARGEITVIMDSESRPEPDQIKKIHMAFLQKAGTNVAAIQAKTLVSNDDENWLTKHHASEYNFHHKVVVQTLAKHRLLPLFPGNSVYIKTNVLRQSGGLDVFNSTEDCEFGVRFTMDDYEIASVNSATWEEAPSEIAPWIRQRTRWFKGFDQTWLKYMRNPLKTYQRLGFKNFLAFHVLIGSTPLIPFLNPIFWALTVVYLISEPDFIEQMYPETLFYLGLLSMVSGNFLMILLTYAGCIKGKSDGHVRTVLCTIWLYWILQAIAAWREKYQLITRPHMWELTPKVIRTETEDLATEVQERTSLG